VLLVSGVGAGVAGFREVMAVSVQAGASCCWLVLQCARLAMRPAASPAIIATRMTVISQARSRRRDRPPGRPLPFPPLIARDCPHSWPVIFLARHLGSWPAGKSE